MTPPAHGGEGVDIKDLHMCVTWVVQQTSSPTDTASQLQAYRIECTRPAHGLHRVLKRGDAQKLLARV